jgi:hypothetical protein
MLIFLIQMSNFKCEGGEWFRRGRGWLDLHVVVSESTLKIGKTISADYNYALAA